MDTNKKDLLAQPHEGPVDPPVSGSSFINVGQTERIVSATGGALLTLFGLGQLSKESRSSLGGFALALAGGALLFRGASGHCPINAAVGRDTTTTGRQAVKLEINKTITVFKPRQEVYWFWRKLENLPRFMQHLSEVSQIDEKRSHWQARIPMSMGQISWDAEIIADEENQRIAWCSIPGAAVDNAGEVRFRDAPGNRGTEIQAIISYRPPAGDIGGLVAKWLNGSLEQMVKEDLRRFKHIIETGELPTIEGQSSGRKNRHDPIGNQPVYNNQFSL